MKSTKIDKMLPGLAHILALSDSVRRWLDYFSKLGQLQQEKLPKKLGNFAKVGSKFFSPALKNPQPNDKAKPPSFTDLAKSQPPCVSFTDGFG